MRRCDESSILDAILNQDIEKKAACGIERISYGSAKKDPFEDIDLSDVWKIQGNSLLKRKENV